MSWASFVRHAATPAVSLEPPRALFDRLQQTQGVLFLNAGLTLTRYQSGGAPEQTRGHIPFWRPVVGQVLRSIATRESGHVVFLCLGELAQKLLASEGVKRAATQAGTWNTRAGQVTLPHPVAPRLHKRAESLRRGQREARRLRRGADRLVDPTAPQKGSPGTRLSLPLKVSSRRFWKSSIRVLRPAARLTM